MPLFVAVECLSKVTTQSAILYSPTQKGALQSPTKNEDGTSQADPFTDIRFVVQSSRRCLKTPLWTIYMKTSG